jgi:hypothetical protein
MLATDGRVARHWLRSGRVGFDACTVQITSRLVRVKGERLLRRGTKGRAGGEELAAAPESGRGAASTVQGPGSVGSTMYPDVRRGFRNGANVGRELREVRRGEIPGRLEAALAPEAALREAFPGGKRGAGPELRALDG